MSSSLVSLREVTEDFNAGKCRLQTNVEMHIGGVVTQWTLIIDTEWYCYDNHGRLMYRMSLHRADATLGEPEWEPDQFEGRGPRDVDVLTQVFGINPDARVWRKGSVYDKE